MAKFELVDEEPKNTILVKQMEDMLIGPTREWALSNSFVIYELDEEKAKRIDDCVNSIDWLKQIEGDKPSEEDDVIMEFLNKRPAKYKQGARVRRRTKNQVEEIIEEGPEFPAS